MAIRERISYHLIFPSTDIIIIPIIPVTTTAARFSIALFDSLDLPELTARIFSHGSTSPIQPFEDKIIDTDGRDTLPEEGHQRSRPVDEERISQRPAKIKIYDEFDGKTIPTLSGRGRLTEGEESLKPTRSDAL
jgi:hypothetical protein